MTALRSWEGFLFTVLILIQFRRIHFPDFFR